LFKYVLFLNKLDGVEHGLVVDGGEASNNLKEEVVLRVTAGVVG
jgi:hypothetical protein